MKVSEQPSPSRRLGNRKDRQPHAGRAVFSTRQGGVAAVCVFFYFGPGNGGGAQANLQRWVGQFAEDPKPNSRWMT